MFYIETHSVLPAFEPEASTVVLAAEAWFHAASVYPPVDAVHETSLRPTENDSKSDPNLDEAVAQLVVDRLNSDSPKASGNASVGDAAALSPAPTTISEIRGGR